MTIEEKNLLLKDICARLTYGVIVHDEYCKKDYKLNSLDTNGFINYDIANHITHIKPYLRPMSSMTEEEKETYECFFNEDGLINCSVYVYVDWLLEHHFDYRGLIHMGLALEAPKDMYKITDTTI